MKYKNNREAILGDPIIGAAKEKPFAGVFAGIETEATTLKQRLRVLVHHHKSDGPPHAKSTYESGYVIAEADDCLHGEDALKTLESPAAPEKPASTEPAKTETT